MTASLAGVSTGGRVDSGRLPLPVGWARGPRFSTG